MSERDRFDPEAVFEPERYELAAGPAYRFDLPRREFLKAVGGGLVIVLLLEEAARAFPPPQESGRDGRRGGGGGRSAPREVGAWIHVGADGVVTANTGKAEVGQDIRTSLAQAVADEMRVPVESVRLVMADTALVPYDMGTFGSRTTPSMAPLLRQAAAAAREALVDLAAARLEADRASLAASDGRVSHAASGRSASYGELTRGEKIVKVVGEDARPAPRDAWASAGRSVPKVNARAIVTGAETFVPDVKRDGLLVGKVLRPPDSASELVSADTTAAAAPGVTIVSDGGFVGVAAEDEAAAARALALVRAEWRRKPDPMPASPAELSAFLKANEQGSDGGGRSNRDEEGSIDDGLAAADARLEATYDIAYIAHVPLEPRAAVAEWNGDGLTVWTGTQRPFGVRSELASAFAVPEDSVRVICPATGSGYGGKHTGEAAIEAARLARAARRPVRVVFTREEEFERAYFRPAGVIDVRCGVKKDGTITAWEFRNWNSGSSGIASPYAAANRRVEFRPSRSPFRQGSYRALAATANAFARESHADDAAHAIGLDPLDFRLKNLREDRLRAVLEAAAEKFSWRSRKDSPARGHGLACATEKGGYVATCAEVSVDPATGRVAVVRAVTAFECGAIVNPEHLENQVEGSVVMGIGGALFEAIDFRDGKVLNGRLSAYRVPRFSDVPPRLETVLLDRRDLPSAGGGETPILAIAPAIGNAIRAATGTRLRSLPMAPSRS